MLSITIIMKIEIHFDEFVGDHPLPSNEFNLHGWVSQVRRLPGNSSVFGIGNNFSVKNEDSLNVEVYKERRKKEVRGMRSDSVVTCVRNKGIGFKNNGFPCRDSEMAGSRDFSGGFAMIITKRRV